MIKLFIILTHTIIFWHIQLYQCHYYCNFHIFYSIYYVLFNILYILYFIYCFLTIVHLFSTLIWKKLSEKMWNANKRVLQLVIYDIFSIAVIKCSGMWHYFFRFLDLQSSFTERIQKYFSSNTIHVNYNGSALIYRCPSILSPYGLSIFCFN